MDIVMTKGRRIALAAGAVAFIALALAIYLGWSHLVFWYRFEPHGVNARHLPEYSHRQKKIVYAR